MNEINNIKPIQRLCMTIGELPTSYMESMTYYEMLEWLCKYLQDTILPKMNELIDGYNGTDEKLKAFMEELSNNLLEVANEILNEKIANGEIIVSLGINYDEDTEALTFSIGAEPSEQVMQILSSLATPSEEV